MIEWVLIILIGTSQQPSLQDLPLKVPTKAACIQKEIEIQRRSPGLNAVCGNLETREVFDFAPYSPPGEKGHCSAVCAFMQAQNQAR